MRGISDVRRVVVTGDLLRPFKVGQRWESCVWKNIRWLYHMLCPAFHDLEIEFSQLTWNFDYSSTPIHRFDTGLFYANLGLEINHENWARISNSDEAAHALCREIEHLRGALVVGYEMPKTLTLALQLLEVPYVDIALHPIRFLADLLYGIASNVDSINGKIQDLEFDARQMVIAQHDVQAKASWLPRPLTNIVPGSALLVGQVSTDRAAINSQGDFRSLESFEEEIADLCQNHTKVYFKPHPYEANSNAKRNLLQWFPKLTEASANVYHILCQPEIVTIAGANSSCLIEAKFFGKKTINFAPFLYPYEPKGDRAESARNTHPPIGPIWTSTEFWNHLLRDDDVERGIRSKKNSISHPNRLRRSMNADWGWSTFDRVVA